MVKPPSGIVTFLFSDIEGSTQRWERRPALMQRAFARQEAIMRAAMAARGGYVYKMIGDAFQVAFASASDAVAAALDAQLDLHNEPWGEIGPIKVRMALHSGETEERGDDYVGPLLNRVARLMSAGHGGQVLLTQAARDLCHDALPPGASLRDMGERRLKDLIQPEHVYQLVAPELPQDFEPLKTLDRRPNNLPAQLTSFVGREREIGEVKRLLSGTRLLTLTGAGGAGKTRLALQTAADGVDDFADGVFLVELAPLADPSLVPQVIAAALGVHEQPGLTLLEAVCDAVREKEMLVLLDNCEHLIEACATAASAVLRAAPKVKILASSREPLRVAGEIAFRVPSLQTPRSDQHWIAEELVRVEAVRLFMERAAAALPGFVVTDANATAVAQVCRRLDGIPLAIELAAARVKALPLEKIATRLDDRFRLLTGGDRSALPRQQTLRATIDWSYSLLSELPPSERAMLRRLSVFAGSWSLEAAEAVCAWETESRDDVLHEADVLDLVTSLVDKSLVIMDQGSDGARYRLLETIREYALNRLREADEETVARERHAAHFFDMAAILEPQLRGGNQKACLDRLELDYDDLRYAFDWLLAHDAERALHLAGALGQFWDIRGHFSEGRETLDRALGAAVSADHLARAKAQRAQGLLALRQGDYAPAEAIIQAALSTSESSDDPSGLVEAFVHLGYLAYLRGEYDAAHAFLAKALPISRDRRDIHGEAYALTILGLVAWVEGDEPDARETFEQALALCRKSGDAVRIGKLLNNLGGLATTHGDYDGARKYYEESLAIKREFADRWGVTYSLVGLGETAFRQGDYPSARTYFEESLLIAQEMGMKMIVASALLGLANVARTEGAFGLAWRQILDSLRILVAVDDKNGIGTVLEDCGKLALAEGDAVSAVHLFAAAKALRATIGASLTAVESESLAHEINTARAMLDAATFDQAWLEGCGMTISQVEALMLSRTAMSAV